MSALEPCVYCRQPTERYAVNKAGDTVCAPCWADDRDERDGYDDVDGNDEEREAADEPCFNDMVPR